MARKFDFQGTTVLADLSIHQGCWGKRFGSHPAHGPWGPHKCSACIGLASAGDSRGIGLVGRPLGVGHGVCGFEGKRKGKPPSFGWSPKKDTPICGLQQARRENLNDLRLRNIMRSLPPTRECGSLSGGVEVALRKS